ncbi:MAG: DNA-processing protein DprA [Eubacteriales bacterium]|nr:DNA-processing protein DprA [Eubacteriales bacterium]
MEKYWLWLCTRKELYRPQIACLLQYFQSPENLFYAPDRQVLEMQGIPQRQKEMLLADRKEWDYEKTMHELEKKGIRFISFFQPEYPARLRELSDYPFGIFVKGALPKPGGPAAAVIGARRCSAYGREKAGRIGRILAERGVQVVSGMALGVDGAAQNAAVCAGGKSFSVLGCGVDICYPREHIGLYDRLCQSGGILSEYPPGMPPVSWHFPVRNRLISALADCVIVIEAKERSGSLITADLAAEQGKDVLAVPGRMEDPLSRGCNRLIAQGAGILWEEEEIFRCLGLEGTTEGKSENKKLVLEKKENMVYSGVDFHDKSLDTICRQVSLPRAEVLETLVSLQLRGLIKETAKNYYVKVQNVP